jgi:hypothetical protein
VVPPGRDQAAARRAQRWAGEPRQATVGAADVWGVAGSTRTRITLMRVFQENELISSNKYTTPKSDLRLDRIIKRLLSTIYGFTRYIILRPRNSFLLRGEQYDYFYHRYNMTWDNERCVELPVIWREVAKFHDKSVLEVGNVLAHYFHVNHDVVDKYEIAGNVINEDIVEFVAENKYDLIVSISTIEHVGWDESPRNVGKIIAAIEKLKQMIKPGGTIIITLPMGYNEYMDGLIFNEALCFDEVHYFMREDRDNWSEVSLDKMRGVKYGHPFRSANGLIFGIFFAKPDFDCATKGEYTV